ncbi:threonylcarbamoyladenosine tRNA methylthiotransferase [Olea europaea subsp. europaea]|uniref:Threonylcarbamoyladenosine tRNA methylthiotransferase n=1 Tax=Olea europaea subsp. europaea TaxID=158383 RepID=A0A8S0PE30_OLEEU|nr:threonylcarbamoyladenosine tRNA methylthiotransferase [Olea europaea subsp. europaea]
MEDREDLLACGGGSPPGFRLPLTAAVGVNPKHKKKNKTVSSLPKSISFLQYSVNSYDTTKIPGTETIYIKIFGCSHNRSDSEYMAGLLSAFGYNLSDNPDEADLGIINKFSGCVPQGCLDLKDLEGLSIVGVRQIDRVVKVVEETLKGHEVRLLTRKTLPALDLPKVRKNKFC